MLRVETGAGRSVLPAVERHRVWSASMSALLPAAWRRISRPPWRESSPCAVVSPPWRAAAPAMICWRRANPNQKEISEERWEAHPVPGCTQILRELRAGGGGGGGGGGGVEGLGVVGESIHLLRPDLSRQPYMNKLLALIG